MGQHLTLQEVCWSLIWFLAGDYVLYKDGEFFDQHTDSSTMLQKYNEQLFSEDPSFRFHPSVWLTICCKWQGAFCSCSPFTNSSWFINSRHPTLLFLPRSTYCLLSKVRGWHRSSHLFHPIFSCTWPPCLWVWTLWVILDLFVCITQLFLLSLTKVWIVKLQTNNRANNLFWSYQWCRYLHSRNGYPSKEFQLASTCLSVFVPPTLLCVNTRVYEEFTKKSVRAQDTVSGWSSTRHE